MAGTIFGLEKLKAMVCWDRHNRLFAYGNVAPFIDLVLSEGFTEGTFKIPAPHSHHYNQEFDGEEMSVLKELNWKRVPLMDGDDE